MLTVIILHLHVLFVTLMMLSRGISSLMFFHDYMGETSVRLDRAFMLRR